MRRKLLIASTLLNVLLIAGALYAFVAFQRLIKELHQIGYERWKSQFDVLAVPKDSIVFLGDSMTELCHWSELLENPAVLNRGIGGDTTRDVLNRVAQIYKLRPQKLFLMIGVNDLNQGIASNITQANLQELFDGFAKELPQAKLFIQSILPVNDQWKWGKAKNPDIVSLNNFLRIEASKRGYQFIDLVDAFADSEGALRSELSNDGIHLLGPAYQLWRDGIKGLVNAKGQESP